MPNPWLRLWTDMPNDPKWRTIARISGASISSVQAVFLQLLASASSCDERGRTQTNAEDIASALDEQTERIQSVLDAMQGRVLDGDYLSGWEKRQPIREDDSAKRAKEWRERKRTQANASERLEEKREEEIREEKETEEPASTADAVPASPPVETFPLLAGRTHTVTEADVASWQRAYPAVDVRAELRRVLVWLDAHPEKRSAKPNGSKQRIVRWLTSTQDKGGSRNGIAQGNRDQARPAAAVERQRVSHDSIRAAGERRYGVSPVDAAGSGPGPIPEPGSTGGNAGYVPRGVGGDGDRVRDGTVSGRVIEGHP